MSISDIRKDYRLSILTENDISNDPIKQFKKWFDDALISKISEPNAMNLATVDTNGKPSLRVVLLKEFNRNGFTWFTNYNSKKGRDLSSNPYAAITFFWVELERQIRIEGKVKKISKLQNDNYFKTRPLKSRIGAISSEQSNVIKNRDDLDRRFKKIESISGNNPTRPAHWGGYLLKPNSVEFWQGRSSRLHDRILYIKNNFNKWETKRLQP